MKWIGFFLVLIGSGGIGFSLVLEYTGRLRELTTVRQMIHYIADAILYDGLPLAEAFFQMQYADGRGIRRISGKNSAADRDFLRRGSGVALEKQCCHAV